MSSPPPPRSRARFGPERIAFFPLLLVFLGALPLATSSRWLLPLLLVPVAGAVWAFRARVVVDPAALEVSNGLGVRRWTWDQVQGFDVPRRGPVRVLVPDGRVALTALPRRELPELLEAAEDLAGPGAARP